MLRANAGTLYTVTIEQRHFVSRGKFENCVRQKSSVQHYIRTTRPWSGLKGDQLVKVGQFQFAPSIHKAKSIVLFRGKKVMILTRLSEKSKIKRKCRTEKQDK